MVLVNGLLPGPSSLFSPMHAKPVRTITDNQRQMAARPSRLSLPKEHLQNQSFDVRSDDAHDA
jgi:hypothetical protein